MMRSICKALGLALAFVMAGHATAIGVQAAESASKLTLEEGSGIQVDDELHLALPAGSYFVLRFGEADSEGRVPIALSPEDVHIEAVALPDGRRMKYVLAEEGSGTLERTDSGLRMSLAVTVKVGVEGRMGREVRSYPLFLTTETAIAVNESRTRLATLQGERISEAARSVKLVGGTTNASDAVVGKGELAGAVLAGRLDRLPVVP